MSFQSDFDERDPEQDDPWSSIVDLMSAFALVLFLAVTFFVINYNRATKILKQRQDQLVAKESALQSSMLALRDKTASLKRSQESEASLTKEKQEIQRQLILLAEKEKTLRTEREQLLGDRQQLLADKQKLLAEQQKLKEEKDKLTLLLGRQENLVAQQKQLAQQQQQETVRQQRLAEMAQDSQKRCQDRLQSILKQREQVLSAVYRSFVIAQKQSQQAAVGFDPKTGRFRLGGEVLFAKGKDTLTEEGKRQLRIVMNALNKVVLQREIERSLSGIMIEGHTDTTGAESTNWQLSSRRSLSALRYLLSLAGENKDRYSKLLFAAAYGQFRPVRSPSGAVEQDRSRRIEIKIVFKNQEQLQGILQELKP
jgi:outer membrane protein OmpA-like peptidoglycan-associated protein